MTELYCVSLNYATFGIEVENEKVVATAPIGTWMIGKSIKDILIWVIKKKGTLTKIG